MSARSIVDASREKISSMLVLARNACNMHTSVAEVHGQLEGLMREIDASESRDLDKVKTAIRAIAAQYKVLEGETRALVRRTAYQGKRLHDAAQRVLQSKLKPEDALSSMDVNFQSLLSELDEVKMKHATVCGDLKEQACNARAAKEKNAERAKRAEDLKDNAEMCAILAIPGAGLLGAPIVLAKEFAEDDLDDDETAKAVLKGAGGALLGIGLGVALTAISPLLLGYSAICGARLAWLRQSWSNKFKDIEGKIIGVHDIITESNECLHEIKSSLHNLKADIAQWNPSVQRDTVQTIFEDICNSSTELSNACQKYEQSLQSNKNRLKQIGNSS